MFRPKLGIVSKLNATPAEVYANELKQIAELEDVEHEIVRAEDGPEAIVQLLRSSSLSVLTGSHDMILNRDRSVNYENPKVRNTLAALIYLIQEGETDMPVLFVCFSAQLLALALSIWNSYHGPRLKLQSWASFDFEALHFENPLVELPQTEVSVSALDGMGQIFSMHSQYIHPARLNVGSALVRRVQGRAAVMVFKHNGWVASQFHPDYSGPTARRYSGGQLNAAPIGVHWLLTEMVEAAKLSAL